MSARAQRNYRTNRSYQEIDDNQQQALLNEALRERALRNPEGDGPSAAYGALWNSQLAWLLPWSCHKLPKALRGKLDADDLGQEIYCRSWRAWADCRSVTIKKFRAWLVTTAERALADATDFYVTAQCRAAAREVRMDERTIDGGQDIACQLRTPDNGALVGDLEQRLTQALADLPADVRLVVMCHVVERQSYAEIGRGLQCAPTKARDSYQGAIATLRRTLAADR